jgi:hypothetical protein
LIADCRLPIADCPLSTQDCGLPIAEGGLRIVVRPNADRKPWTLDQQSPIASESAFRNPKNPHSANPKWTAAIRNPQSKIGNVTADLLN